MPQICTFYGIIIFLNYNDHMPPHFHAWYNEYKITVNITDGVVKGEMPARALRMILEWLDLHREEIMHEWLNAREGKVLNHLEPLK